MLDTIALRSLTISLQRNPEFVFENMVGAAHPTRDSITLVCFRCQGDELLTSSTGVARATMM